MNGRKSALKSYKSEGAKREASEGRAKAGAPFAKRPDYPLNNYLCCMHSYLLPHFEHSAFALMKDNLDAFEVLFCPLGRMQGLTHARTHARDGSAQHAEQQPLHLYLTAPSNPAIV